jgi:hypothetical protein
MKKLIDGLHTHARVGTKKGRTLTLFTAKRKKKRATSKKTVEFVPELYESPVAMA